MLGRANEIILEICQHLEMLGEFWVECGEQEIQKSLAEQDNLDLERDRIRLQGNGAGQAEEAPDILDSDLAAPQCAFERGPGERLHQYAARIEQQITTVGPVDRACFDQPKIGDQRAADRNVLDAADEIGKRGMQLLYNRRARLGIILGDENIDFVALEGTGGNLGTPLFAVTGLEKEKTNIFDKIRVHRLDMLHDARQILEQYYCFFNQLAHRVTCGIPVKLADLVATLSFPLRNLMDDVF